MGRKESTVEERGHLDPAAEKGVGGTARPSEQEAPAGEKAASAAGADVSVGGKSEPAREKLSPEDTLDLTGIEAVDQAASVGLETSWEDWAFVEPGSERGPKVIAAAPMPILNRRGYRVAKRLFDIAFSACVVAVGLIPGAALCLAIRLESPGNPIYVQRRVARITRRGEVRTFPMLKFRSMYEDADERLEELRAKNEADGPLFKIKDDPRVTKIGRFIRRHSIDEFPQFLNVLAGDLSVVGPRPALPREVKQYDGRAMRRLSVKPGLTCYWQTQGRSDTTFDEMVDLDLRYIEERSFLTDLKCIFDTVKVVFTGDGAF